jgi:hypothetical protein
LAAAVFTMRIQRNEERHKTVNDLRKIGLAAFALAWPKLIEVPTSEGRAFAFKRVLASRTIETGYAV